MKSLLIFLFVAHGIPAICQIHANSGPMIKAPLATAEFFTDVSGRPIFPGGYVDVHGSPFWQEDWKPAYVVLGTGKKLAGLLVRLDLLKHEVYYMDETHNEMIAKKGVVKELVFVENGDSIRFRAGFPPIENNTLATLYEVLATGKTVLLKQHIKVIMETKPFNSATTERTFVGKEEYYLSKQGQTKLTKIKKDRKDVLEALADRQKNVEGYMKSNGLKCRSEKDLIEIVGYYNALE